MSKKSQESEFRFKFQGSGFRIKDLGHKEPRIRIHDSGYITGSGHRRTSGFRIQGLWFRIKDSGHKESVFRIQGLGFRIKDLGHKKSGFRIQGLGFRV